MLILQIIISNKFSIEIKQIINTSLICINILNINSYLGVI